MFGEISRLSPHPDPIVEVKRLTEITLSHLSIWDHGGKADSSALDKAIAANKTIRKADFYETLPIRTKVSAVHLAAGIMLEDGRFGPEMDELLLQYQAAVAEIATNEPEVSPYYIAELRAKFPPTVQSLLVMAKPAFKTALNETPDDAKIAGYAQLKTLLIEFIVRETPKLADDAAPQLKVQLIEVGALYPGIKTVVDRKFST